MKNDFATIVDLISSGKSLVVCAKSREDTELYAQTLAKISPKADVVPWTEDEDFLCSLTKQNNIIAGSPLRYLMKLTEDGIPTINFVFYRLHCEDVVPTDRWKNVAKHASKKFNELGEDAIYEYLQAQMKDEVIQKPQMKDEVSYTCPECGGSVTFRKIALNKIQYVCETCRNTWTE
jgi:predicted RNA-binding Zn-ribbon protein involved in translation (DUF1610 family)